MENILCKLTMKKQPHPSEPIRLRRGITGFQNISDDYTPRVDYQKFCRFAYAIVRHTGGKVRELKEDGIGRNYYAATVAVDNDIRYLLCNAQYPIVAWSRNLPNTLVRIQFIDVPLTGTALEPHSDFYVSSTVQLNATLKEQDLSELAAPECFQIEYWAPDTLGALIFNGWD